MQGCIQERPTTPDMKAALREPVEQQEYIPRPCTPPQCTAEHSSDEEEEPDAKFRKLRVGAYSHLEKEEAVALVASRFNAQSLLPSEMDDTLREYAKAAADSDAFFTVDVGAVLSRFEEWQRALPRVTPYYAVKCCSEPAVIASLVALGAGFDCASPAEMELVIEHGATPERIVYAHAVKPVIHINAARAMGVSLMTFDSKYVSFRRPFSSLPHAPCVPPWFARGYIGAIYAPLFSLGHPWRNTSLTCQEMSGGGLQV